MYYVKPASNTTARPTGHLKQTEQLHDDFPPESCRGMASFGSGERQRALSS